MILWVIDIEQRLYREAEVRCSLSHKNVMPLLGLCHSVVGQFPAMISYLYDKCNVYDYLAKNSKVDRLEIVSLRYPSRNDIVGFIFFL